MKHFLLATLALGAVAVGARAANPVVVMETSMGTIKIELYEDKAPGTVNNINQTSNVSTYINFQTVGNGFFGQPGKVFLNNARTMQLSGKFSF